MAYPVLKYLTYITVCKIQDYGPEIYVCWISYKSAEQGCKQVHVYDHAGAILFRTAAVQFNTEVSDLTH